MMALILYLCSSNAGLSQGVDLEGNGCGVILHCHINKCAGDTMQQWFKSQIPHKNYLRLYHNTRIQAIDQSFQSWMEDIPKVGKFIENLTTWKVLEIHHGFPGMYYTKEYFSEWENVIKNQGCRLYRTVIIRHPLDRFISNVIYNEVPQNELHDFVQSRENWLARYIMFNTCGVRENKEIYCGYDKSGAFTMTTQFDPQRHENELRKIIESFDFIGFVKDLGGFQRHIQLLMGWNKTRDLKHVHQTQHYEMKFDRKLIKEFIKRNERDDLLYSTLLQSATYQQMNETDWQY